jgi:hypothetical protein
MAEAVRKLDYEVLNLRDATSNKMIETATSLSSTQDSSLGRGLTALALDERIRELRILLRKDEEMAKAIKNIKHSLQAANVLKRESLDQLQEQPSASAPLQTEEMDAFAEHRAEAIESRSATDRGLVGP